MIPPEIVIHGVAYVPVAAPGFSEMGRCSNCVCMQSGRSIDSQLQLCNAIHDALCAMLGLPDASETHTGYYYVVKDATPDPNPL